MISILVSLLLAAGCILQPDSVASVEGGRDSLLVMFWNLENFFDWEADETSGADSSDREFSSNGKRHWTRGRFYTKCNAVAKIILAVADRYGHIPDVIGLAELENGLILRRLVSSTPLRKAGFKTLHFDSPDSRGIDCGLLYRGMTLRHGEAKHLYDSSGAVMATRDILLAEFDSVCVMVNHHPSKVGSGKQERRDIAMARLLYLCDSLAAAGHGRVLAIGDFNDDIWGSGDIRGVFNQIGGTIKYNGKWEKIDGCLSHSSCDTHEDIFDHPLLLEKDKAFGGLKPRRTYSGPRYLGGVSDHLPIVIQLRY